MTLPPSRLLSRLDAAIAAERDPFRADLLRAERAAYWARQGQAEEARTELDALHKRYDGRPNFEMSVWLSIAESLGSFFSDTGPAALDKMRRARAMSEAANLPQLQALSAAWLAHMDYLRLDLPAMTRHLAQSLKLAGPENHAARSRANLVVAQAYHVADRLDLALPWYSKAREHAVSDGDDATISALMHNMAWIRTANMRNAMLTGSEDSGEGQHALIAAESTWTFDKLVGAVSLGSFVPLLHAQILSLQGKPALALELYEKYLESGVAQGLERLNGSLLADQAWCRAHVGQLEEARRDAEAAVRALEPDGSFDDRATGYSRVAQVFALLGDAEAATQNQSCAAVLWAEFAKIRERIIDTLRPVAEAHGSPE